MWLKIFAMVLVLCMVFTQTAFAYEGTFDFVKNDEVDKVASEEFIQPEKVDLNFNNEYKKSPLLRFPVVSTAPEEEIEGKLIAVSQYSKIYKTDDNTYKTVYTSLPNTYKDDEGVQHEIDNTLIKKDNSFINKANSLKVNLPDEITEGKCISVSNKGIDFRLVPVEGDFTKAAVKKNAILYNDVFDGIDYQYTVNELSLKEDIVLNKYVDKNTFKYAIELDNLEFKCEDNLIKAYKKGEADPSMILSAPVMSDASGAVSEKVSISLDTSFGKNIVTVTADKDWIADPARAFPVRIDPSVTVPASKIREVTVCTGGDGRYYGDSYGYAGYVTRIDNGTTTIPDAFDLKESRMMFQINDNFSSIPDDATYRISDSWNPNTIKWDQSCRLNAHFQSNSNTKTGQHRFNVLEAVNGWIKGSYTNNGLMIKALQESSQYKGGAFYTPLSSANGNGGQGGFTPDKAPRLEIVGS